MHISVYNQQKDLILATHSVKSVVKEVLSGEQIETDEVTVYFVTTSEICRLHLDFFADPSPTDCISFPIDPIDDQLSGYHVLGEIFICPRTAIDYLAAHPENHDSYTETTLYIIHGLLHLIGYDDLKDTDRLAMRSAEQRHLHHLITHNLLLKSRKP